VGTGFVWCPIKCHSLCATSREAGVNFRAKFSLDFNIRPLDSTRSVRCYRQHPPHTNAGDV
jgi:hypothetical protein